MAGRSPDVTPVSKDQRRGLKPRWVVRFATMFGLLRLLLFGWKRDAPSKGLVDRGGWGMTQSGTPSGYTAEGQLAQMWAFIGGAQTRRSPRFRVALWALRVVTVVVVLGVIAQAVWVLWTYL